MPQDRRLRSKRILRWSAAALLTACAIAACSNAKSHDNRTGDGIPVDVPAKR